LKLEAYVKLLHLDLNDKLLHFSYPEDLDRTLDAGESYERTAFPGLGPYLREDMGFGKRTRGKLLS
jgi:hypothetical protein